MPKARVLLGAAIVLMLFVFPAAAQATAPTAPYDATLALSKSKIFVNDTVKFSGKVLTAAGKPASGTVTIQKRRASGGSWLNWRTDGLDSTGYFTKSVRMTSEQTWEFRAKMPGNAANAPGYSPLQGLQVVRGAYDATLALSKSKIFVNDTVKFSGKVLTAAGKPASGTVTIQKRRASGGSWLNWRTDGLDSTGYFTKSVRMTSEQTWEFRAKMPGNAANAPGYSPLRKLEVRAPTPIPTSLLTLDAPDPGVVASTGYTLVQNKTIHNLDTNGLSYRYYYNCTFTGGSASEAVLSFKGTSSHLLFDSCTIAKGGGWNGITINDSYRRIHDITFKRCLIKTQGRMGFECTSRPTSAATQYQRIDIIDSTFEPQGNQAVSYDGGRQAGKCTFSGNVVKGAGVNPKQPYGAGFEINGPSDMTVTDNRIYQCRDSILNLKRHTSSASGWVFANNVFDASTHIQQTQMDRFSQVVLAFNVRGGRFAGNTIVSDAAGGSVAYMSGCRNMDWRTSTWRDAKNRKGYATPTRVNGCSGNLW